MKIIEYCVEDRTGTDFIITGKGKPLQVLLSDILGGRPIPMLHWLTSSEEGKYVLQVRGYKPGEEVYINGYNPHMDTGADWQYINTTKDGISWFWKVG